MNCVWDEQKSILNLQKHGLSFSDAHHVFKSEYVTFIDDRYDYGEPRFITLGKLAERLIVLVHTPRGKETRIISMRKANEREHKIYQQRLSET